MATLPYVTAPGGIEKALKGIKSAATPATVSQDFVKTILKIKGGSGNQMTSYLKKIGFANADGTPSDIYKSFRNTTTEGKAAADALRYGYQPLFARNEYMYKLSDEELRGLIIEETGQGDDSNVVNLILSCVKAIKKFATWSTAAPASTEKQAPEAESATSALLPAQEVNQGSVGLNLSYTINLNLPATSDIAVFNAIFRSLKETLLKNSNDKY